MVTKMVTKLWKKNTSSAYVCIGLVAGAFAVVGALSALGMSLAAALRAVFGTAYLIFLPGLALSYALFENLGKIERIVMAFALSIATVVLVVYALNLAGVPITDSNTMVATAVIVLVSILFAFLRRKKVF